MLFWKNKPLSDLRLSSTDPTNSERAAQGAIGLQAHMTEVLGQAR